MVRGLFFSEHAPTAPDRSVNSSPRVSVGCYSAVLPVVFAYDRDPNGRHSRRATGPEGDPAAGEQLIGVVTSSPPEP